jgi:hypothetical protein
MKTIELSAEVADGITLCTLKEHREDLANGLQKWKDNPKSDSNPNGYWMHPDDVLGDAVIIEAMDKVIHYYGG